MFWRPPRPEDCGPGLTADDYAPDETAVWPENVEAVSLVRSIASQWRIGASGPCSLDFSVLFSLMDRLEIPAPRQLALLGDVRVLEAAALEAMYPGT